MKNKSPQYFIYCLSAYISHQVIFSIRGEFLKCLSPTQEFFSGKLTLQQMGNAVWNVKRNKTHSFPCYIHLNGTSNYNAQTSCWLLI